jgi:hypothetical protein
MFIIETNIYCFEIELNAKQGLINKQSKRTLKVKLQRNLKCNLEEMKKIHSKRMNHLNG